MKLKIGSHVGMSGKDMLLGSAKEAYSYGANVFMVYTGAPQNTRRKDISELKIKEAWEYMAMGSRIMVLHPGSHVGAGVDAGINQIVKGINNVLTKDSKACIALETMAGKGSEIGRNFEELARIYDGVVYNDKLRVCFDTCHVNDAGYDLVNDLSGVFEKFDKVIGTDQIGVFHINDSKNVLGAGKDRHENIGFGNIGYDTLRQIIYMEQFENIPKILETPYVKDPENSKKSYAPYKFEIEMIKKGEFNNNLQNEILQNGR